MGSTRALTAALIAGAMLGWSSGWLAGKEDSKVPDYINVDVCGVLNYGVVAIGGETTGAEITAKKITWELDFKGDEAWMKSAEELNGKVVAVKGELEKRKGIERPDDRWIVKVKEFKAAE